MFDTKRRLSAIEADIRGLKAETERQLAELRQLVDAPELERMRGSVLNALRALRRSQSAQDERDHGNGQGAGDAIDRQLAVRRGASRGVL
jgi:hypothetical protein